MGHIHYLPHGPLEVYIQNTPCLDYCMFAKDGSFLFWDIWATFAILQVGNFRLKSILSGATRRPGVLHHCLKGPTSVCYLKKTIAWISLTQSRACIDTSMNYIVVHPSIIYTAYPLKVTRGARAFRTLDRSPAYHRADIQREKNHSLSKARVPAENPHTHTLGEQANSEPRLYHRKYCSGILS